MNMEELASHARASSHDEHLSTSTRPVRAKRRRRIVVFLLVSLLNIGLLTLLASQILNPAQGTPSGGGTSSLIGKLAPDFILPRLGASTASTIHLSALKGKPVILNFWASWCDACKEEAPLLQKTWQQVSQQGVMLVGIDSGDTSAPAKRFVEDYGITYPNVVDSANGTTAINYGVTGFPETFFLDRHGIIIHKEIGALSSQMMQQDLRQLGALASPRSSVLFDSLDARGRMDEALSTSRREGSV